MARLELTAGVTQKELGRKYQVSAGTISSNFRAIWRTLGLRVLTSAILPKRIHIASFLGFCARGDNMANAADAPSEITVEGEVRSIIFRDTGSGLRWRQ